MKNKNYVINIFGATASNKSAIALSLAKELKSCVINADSSQVYKEAPILSNLPSMQDLLEVPHKLYSIISVAQTFSVKNWLDLAKIEIEKSWSNACIPIIVGGTGLYFSSLLYGINNLPNSVMHKQQSISLYNEIGYEEFFKLVKSIDPEFVEQFQDKQRLMRAYEVYLISNKKFSEWQSVEKQKVIDANFINIFVNKDREILRKDIEKRFDLMLEKGAIKEVEELLKFKNRLVLKKFLGASSIAEYLEHQATLSYATEHAKIKTKQYAKRQLTWFNNQIINKISVEYDCNIIDIIKLIKSKMQ